MSSIYRDHKHGTYYYSCMLADGTRLRRSLKTKNARTAKALGGHLDRCLQSEAAEDCHPIRLSDAIKRFLGTRRDLTPRTQDWYRSSLKQWQAWLGADPPLESITSERLLEYRFQRHDAGISPSTIHGDIRVIRALFQRVPGIQQRARVVLTPAEIKVYQAVLQSRRVYPIFMFGCFAGLRLSEMIFLQSGDIRPYERNGYRYLIQVANKPELGFTTKNYKFRLVPVEDELEPLVTSLPDKGPAIPSPKGFYWERNNLYREWVQAMNELKLPPERSRGWGLRIHELRHTYASIQIQDRGTDILTLMRRMGHSNLSTTQGYLHLFSP